MEYKDEVTRMKNAPVCTKFENMMSKTSNKSKTKKKVEDKDKSKKRILNSFRG